MKTLVELLSIVNSFTLSDVEKLVKNVVFETLSNADMLAVARLSDMKKAIDDKLAKMLLSVDVTYCKDDRLTLYYLVSNDEKQSYIAKMYLHKANSENAYFEIFVHSALLKKIAEHDELKKLLVNYKQTQIIRCEYAKIADVLALVKAVSKAK